MTWPQSKVLQFKSQSSSDLCTFILKIGHFSGATDKTAEFAPGSDYYPSNGHHIDIGKWHGPWSKVLWFKSQSSLYFGTYLLIMFHFSGATDKTAKFAPCSDYYPTNGPYGHWEMTWPIVQSTLVKKLELLIILYFFTCNGAYFRSY